MTSKILYHEDYVDMLRAVKIQNNQKALKSDIILKIDSDALSSQLIINDIESSSMLRDLSMSDQSIRKTFTSKKKTVQENQNIYFWSFEKTFDLVNESESWKYYS